MYTRVIFKKKKKYEKYHSKVKGNVFTLKAI